MGDGGDDDVRAEAWFLRSASEKTLLLNITILKSENLSQNVQVVLFLDRLLCVVLSVNVVK